MSKFGNALLYSASAGLAALCVQLYMNRKTDKKYEIPESLLKSPYAKELTLAVRLALRAGANMSAFLQERGTALEAQHELGISTKGQPEDFCTKIDVDNERLITKEVFANFPSHEIIGEETTGSGKIPPLSDKIPTWIIDPIDGTTNFASGFPLTCVSIGFCVNGKPVMGVIYAPATNELYLAVKGHGAYRNGAEITMRQSRALKDSVLCVEFGYGRGKEAISKMVGALTKILEHGCRTVRIAGSGALDMCYVATGRLDVVYAGVAGEGWKPWDYCAALVVANEVGCVTESIDQKDPGDFTIYSKSIICAVSRDLVNEVRNVIS